MTTEQAHALLLLIADLARAIYLAPQEEEPSPNGHVAPVEVDVQ